MEPLIIDTWVYCDGADEMTRLQKHTRAMRPYNHNIYSYYIIRKSIVL